MRLSTRLLAAMVLALALTACGGAGSSGSEPAADAGDTTADTADTTTDTTDTTADTSADTPGDAPQRAMASTDRDAAENFGDDAGASLAWIVEPIAEGAMPCSPFARTHIGFLAGVLHVVYDGETGPVHGHKVDDLWVVNPIMPSSGTFQGHAAITDMATSTGTGTIHLAVGSFLPYATVEYAFLDAAGWQVMSPGGWDIVGGYASDLPSIATAPDLPAHLVWVGGSHLGVMAFEADEQTYEKNESVRGGSTAAVLEDTGKLHVLTGRGHILGEFVYSTHIEGQWTTETLDAATTIRHFDVKLAADGGIHVAYINESNSLRYAHHSDNEWNWQTIAEGATAAPTIIAAQGVTYIVFRDDNASALVIASTGYPQQVAPIYVGDGIVGANATLDASGLVHGSFCVQGQLHHARMVQ